MTPVRLEPAAPGSRVKHSTTEPLRSPLSASIKDLNKNGESVFSDAQGQLTL